MAKETTKDDPVIDTESSSGDDSSGNDRPSKTKSKAVPTNAPDKRRRLILISAMCCLVFILVIGVTMLLLTSEIGGTTVISVSRNRNAPTEEPSQSPTSFPSSVPSSVPSDLPSMVPSDMPSFMPSDMPSVMPSQSPSDSPTLEPSSTPSSMPSSQPTTSAVKPNPVPNDPYRGYFNYDRSDNRYGPNAWGRVNTATSFMKEFSPSGWGPFRGYEGESITSNKCSSRPDHLQSPRNLAANEPCEGHHEIRTWCGRYSISDSKIDAQILPHKLSLLMNRRKCGDVERDECQEGQPPLVDYPKYASVATSYADLMHYDIKVPAEHQLEGESFDAEIQMFTFHPGTSRFASIGIVVRAESNRHNGPFQAILNEFQKTYDEHDEECRGVQRRLRQGGLNSTDTTDRSYVETLSLNETATNRRRLRGWDDSDMFTDNHDDPSVGPVKQMRQFVGFDPFVDALFPSIYFYRYDGTLTEPPCTGITWFVMEKPIIISFEQLEQIQRLIFTHRNGNCRRTSVHNKDQSVARPRYRYHGDTIIENCLEGTFKSDVEKGRLDGRKCRG